MKKKSKVIITIIIVILLLLIFALLFYIFRRNKSYTIQFNTNGGSEITNIEVKNNETIKLPEAPKKEGYKFAGWTNEKGEIINSDIKVEKNITINTLWIEEDKETNTVSFETGNKVSYGDIIIEEGKYIILPIPPERNGYIFVGWINEDGNIVTSNYIINENTKLTAKWISKDAKIVTLKFNTDGGNEIDNIIVENGKIVSFPTTPIKEGYVFAGWVDKNGKEINIDTTFDTDITLKAIWKELYSCPNDCKVNEDGKTCTKTSTTNLVKTKGCPSGTKLVKGYCLDIKNQYHAISTDTNPFWKCNSSNEYMYTEIDESGLGAFMWCAKKYDKVDSTSCPNGYKKDGDKCTKTEKINCTENKVKEYKNND